jgi:hypothetical protein
MVKQISEIATEGRIISNGPGKYELMTSLFSKGEYVSFTLEETDTIIFCTSSMMAEDGSKNKWIIEGSSKCPNDQYFLNYRLKLYYDAVSRSGRIIECLKK